MWTGTPMGQCINAQLGTTQGVADRAWSKATLPAQRAPVTTRLGVRNSEDEPASPSQHRQPGTSPWLYHGGGARRPWSHHGPSCHRLWNLSERSSFGEGRIGHERPKANRPCAGPLRGGFWADAQLVGGSSGRDQACRRCTGFRPRRPKSRWLFELIPRVPQGFQSKWCLTHSGACQFSRQLHQQRGLRAFRRHAGPKRWRQVLRVADQSRSWETL